VSGGRHRSRVDLRRVGRVIRAVRLQLGLRQVDLAAGSGVSQSAVSRLELGRGEAMSIGDIVRVADALDVRLALDAWWRAGDVSRLLDADHATIVDRVVGSLRKLGWQVRLEYGFNHFGERGSVDIVGWHATTRTLLLIEVKSRLVDLQELLATFARKLRIVPRLLAESEGWAPIHVGRLIVLPGSRVNRAVVDRHANTFEAAFPARANAVRRWLRGPSGSISGIWFVSPAVLREHGSRARRRPRGRIQPR
jgi:transcriptional regulator with XRE-family HTH domain